MLLNKAISVISLLAFLGSSIGIHIVHHDQFFCGRQDRVISFLDIVHHQHEHICNEEHTHNDENICSEVEDENCSIYHHNHQDYCSHEVILIKDSYRPAEGENEIKTSINSPVFHYLPNSDDFLLAAIYLNKILHPPPKLPDLVLLSSVMRC